MEFSYHFAIVFLSLYLQFKDWLFPAKVHMTESKQILRTKAILILARKKLYCVEMYKEVYIRPKQNIVLFSASLAKKLGQVGLKKIFFKMLFLLCCLQSIAA